MITFLKKTFNISGCEIVIEPDRSVYHQGDIINCNFKITGGQEYEQTVDKISISLEESWQESRYKVLYLGPGGCTYHRGSQL